MVLGRQVPIRILLARVMHSAVTTTSCPPFCFSALVGYLDIVHAKRILEHKVLALVLHLVIVVTNRRRKIP